MDDSALPILAVVEDAKPAIEVLAHGSSQPITEKPMSPVPMPWDQIEEAALPISPVAASEFPEPTEVAPTLPVAADLPSSPVAKVQESNIEMPAEGVAIRLKRVQEVTLLCLWSRMTRCHHEFAGERQ